MARPSLVVARGTCVSVRAIVLHRGRMIGVSPFSERPITRLSVNDFGSGMGAKGLQAKMLFMTLSIKQYENYGYL
jgi:hypothetical protein